MENLLEIRNKTYNEDQERVRIINKLTNDQQVIDLINMSEGLKNETSIL